MKLLLRLICAYCIVLLVSAKPFSKDEKQCGYKSCHRINSTILNVHLVPHSHDDVGWLKTVDQYYFGSKSNYQVAGVQYIISTVIESLQANPERRFIQVESAFFWQWWQRQSQETREKVQQLVNEGRLEMINGAWSMNDEAAAHYHSIIDQFTWGLRMINDTLGECGRPKIGWQIDPFGHSNEMASIFSQLGYEGMFFARLDYRDSALRHKTKTLETMWQGSKSLGSKSQLFTGVLYDFYTTPAHFCWDVLCSDIPVNDDMESPDFNQPEIVSRFADYVVKGASYFQTNNLLVTMGGDFTYQNAEMFYINMDRLIAGFKKYRPDINIIYSTPSCYMKAVNDAAKEHGIEFPLKTDDFFPYASGEHSYWTGYFTSRPNSKRFERQGNNMLQVSKQLKAIAAAKKMNSTLDSDGLLKEAMGIMQHHDAITGTEKQHVADDYVRILTKAIKRAERSAAEIIHELLRKDGQKYLEEIRLESCLLSNISYCMPSSDLDEFIVAVYNPLSRGVNHFVHLPVNGSEFEITGTKGLISYDVMPAMADFYRTHKVKSSNNNLIFGAQVPALGISYFHVKKISQDSERIDNEINYEEKATEDRKYIGFKDIGVTIDGKTGKLLQVKMNGIETPITQEFMYYIGANGSNYGEEKRASGAYIFRPAKDTVAQHFNEAQSYQQYSGKHVHEIHQYFSDCVKQIIRIYENENHIEFDWLVGPLTKFYDGVEVITRFTTNLQSNSTFYTDSNGREMIERIRNYRATYEYTNEEPVAGNYYPVTSRIAIKDKARNVEAAILNDRAQGGSSLMDGELELMVHRRLLNDDAFGVGEALNEFEFQHGVMVRGQTYLVIGNITTNSERKNAAQIQKDVAQRKLLAPWTFVGTLSNISLDEIEKRINFEWSALNSKLPENVQILTLEPWRNNDTILLRFEHLFEVQEHPTYSMPAIINLNTLFNDLTIKYIRETTLGANQWIEENEKMTWNTTTTKESSFSEFDQLDMEHIELNPMEIRTFICYLDN